MTLRRACLWDGALWVVLGISVACILSFVLDYLLALPAGVRAVQLLAALVAIGVLVGRRLLAPLSRRLSDEQLAVLIEECHPELQGALVTAVQLHRADSFGGRHVSSQLVDAVVEEVEHRAAGLQPRRVLGLRSLRRNVVLLSVALVLIGTGALARPDLLGIWLRRNVLLGAERWPKSTLLELAPDTPRVVAIGDDVTVSVLILRGDPGRVRIEWQLDEGPDRADAMEVRRAASWDVLLDGVEAGSWDREAARAALAAVRTSSEDGEKALSTGSGPVARGLRAAEAESLAKALRATGARVVSRPQDVAVHEFRNVSRPIRYWVAGGDDRIGPFGIEVRLRPRIDMQSVEVSYRYPWATARDDVEEVQGHGNLRVPVGTEVRYSMATNIPVSKAWFFQRSDEDVGVEGDSGWPPAGSSALELAGGQRFSGSFRVEESGHYAFVFEAADGFRSARPERFRVQAVPDRKPFVRIVEPSRITEDVSTEARVPIRVEVRDDYAVRRAVIEGTYYAPQSEEPVRMSIDLADLASTTPRDAMGKPTEVAIVLDVASIETGRPGGPEPEGRFEFFALAEDFGGLSGPQDRERTGNIGESQVHVLRIVDRESLEKSIVDQTMVLRDALRQIGSRQRSIREDLQALQDDAAVRGELSAEEGGKLARHRQDQDKVSESVSRQAEDIERLLARMEANQVGDEDWKRWMRRVQSKLQEIAQRQSPEVSSELQAMRKDAREAPQDPGRLSKPLASQRQIERDLEALAAELSHFGDINSIIQQIRDLRLRQQMIRDTTREILGTEAPKEP